MPTVGVGVGEGETGAEVLVGLLVGSLSPCGTSLSLSSSESLESLMRV